MELPLHFNHKGPKIFTNYQRVGLIVLFLRSKKSLMEFVETLCESLWPKWLGLREIPGKSTIHDWLKLFELKRVRELNNYLLQKETPDIMAVDATGLDSWQRSRHYENRIRAEHMPYAKADILIDTDTMLVHDFNLRIKPRHDVLGATTMIRRMKAKKVLILGDKGYDSEPLHRLTKNKKNVLFAPIRDFSVNVPKGTNRRLCVKKHEKYSKRSCVESVFHAIKSMKNCLKSKIHYMKKREFAWQVLTYNIKKTIQSINALIKLLSQQLIPDAPEE